MGKWLIDFYKYKIKREYKIAFISTFILALLVHIYLITNNIQSGDAVYNYYHTQNMTVSGRWALSFFCSFSSYFHLPWMSGLIAIIFMSLTTAVLVEIFKIKNPIVIVLMGGLLVSSVSITDALRYIYTADGYMIAMFLASLGVYFTKIGENRFSRYVLGGILLCLSCGIYQAYIPFAIALVVFETIEVILENKASQKKVFKWIKNQIILYVVSVTIYYIIWKICLHFCNLEAHTYLGISEVGKLNLDMILRGFGQIPLIVKRFFFGTPKAVHISPYVILNLAFLFAAFVVIIYLFFKKKVYKKKWMFFVYVLSILLFFPATTFWVFVSEELGVWKYFPRMLGGLALLYIYILVLYEKYCGDFHKNVFMILIVAVIFNNTVCTNILYTCMEGIYERSYGESVEIVSRIHEVVSDYENDNPGITLKEIVFVGQNYSNVSIYNSETLKPTKYANSYPFTYDLCDTYLLDGIHAYLFISENFDIEYSQSWDPNYRDSYLDKEEVKKMPIWPSKNSIAVVDGVIVVKLFDKKEVSA